MNALYKKESLMANKQDEDKCYLEACFVFSKLSYAKRLKVGELLVSPNGVINLGINGTAAGTPNECEFVDERGNLVTHPYVICGAANAIYKAAKQCVKLDGSTLYSTDSPCPKCTHALLSVGVVRVVYAREYRLTDHLSLLRDKGISVEHLPIDYEHLI